MSLFQLYAVSLCAINLVACSAQKSEQAPEQTQQTATPAPIAPQPAQPALAETSATVPKPAAVKIVQPKIPEDVSAFIEQRESCDHFRGEEAYDEERGAFLEKAQKETCTGTDAALKLLRSRYKENTVISIKLKGYEEDVEVAP